MSSVPFSRKVASWIDALGFVNLTFGPVAVVVFFVLHTIEAPRRGPMIDTFESLPSCFGALQDLLSVLAFGVALVAVAQLLLLAERALRYLRGLEPEAPVVEDVAEGAPLGQRTVKALVRAARRVALAFRRPGGLDGEDPEAEPPQGSPRVKGETAAPSTSPSDPVARVLAALGWIIIALALIHYLLLPIPQVILNQMPGARWSDYLQQLGVAHLLGPLKSAAIGLLVILLSRWLLMAEEAVARLRTLVEWQQEDEGEGGGLTGPNV